jgi:LmbE family N-acetylglucosaminyl deacetylase
VAAAAVAMACLTASPAQAAGCRTSSVQVVAHPDDDLFFVNPAILQDIRAGGCSATVYVTSGDAGRSNSYYLQREAGVRAAYAEMADVSNRWLTLPYLVGSKFVMRSVLVQRPTVQLYFLHLPDGYEDGSGSTRSGYRSLQQLFSGETSSLRSLDLLPQTYTRAALVETLGRIMASASPTTIRTMDFTGAFGDGDHSDHHAVGRFALEARAKWAPKVPLTGYLGYRTTAFPANVSGADLTAKMNAYFAYAPHDAGMCTTAEECSYSDAGAWLARQHTNTETPPPPAPKPTGSNVAGSAAATASSDNPADQQTATKAIDGVVDGYPGDHTAEWATQAQGVGGWLQLTWATPVQLNAVVLHDRPNPYDQITGATLTFADGSTVAVPALENAGGATTVTFPARTTTTLRLTVTSVSGTTTNVGLAELEAWGQITAAPAVAAAAVPAPQPAPGVAPQSATSTTTPSTGTSSTTSSTGTTTAPAQTTAPAGGTTSTGETPAAPTTPATTPTTPSSTPAATPTPPGWSHRNG